MRNVFINEESGKLKGLTPRILKRVLLTVASIFFIGILGTQLFAEIGNDALSALSNTLGIDWFIALGWVVAFVALCVGLRKITKPKVKMNSSGFNFGREVQVKSVSSDNPENVLPANLNAKKLNELKTKHKKTTGTWAGRR